MTAMRSPFKLGSEADFVLDPGVVYLNTCGMAPRLRQVDQAARQALVDSARPWAAGADDWLRHSEALRSSAAAVLRAEADALAYIPSVSYAMAVAARNCKIRKGQEVLVLSGEYPSNRMVWQRAAESSGGRVLAAGREPGESWTDAVLRQIRPSTAVASLPPVHWADGTCVDLEAIGQACRAVGAALVVDASQWLGAQRFEFDTIGPDFVVAPGHKWLLGAYGLGWLWAAPRWRESGEPLEQTILAREAFGDFASLGMPLPAYRAGARRFDFGPYPHPLSIPMSQAALTVLQAWGMDAVTAALAARGEALRGALSSRGLGDGLEPKGPAPHYCVWTPPDAAAGKAVAKALSSAAVAVAWRAGRLRLSPHLHIDQAQIQKVATCIAAAV